MTMKKLAKMIPLLLCFMFPLTLAACNDPDSGYIASGLEVKAIPYDYEDDDESFYKVMVENKGIILFQKYDDYFNYHFKLDYTEAYFEENDLLVFVVSCCSSDNMEFSDLLLDDNQLCPLFLSDDIPEGSAVTTDYIEMRYLVEIAKSNNYTEGKILHKYR
jgi:hypothetical protein